MATHDILEAFGADEATWRAAKAAVPGQVDLSGEELNVPASPVPRDLSACLLVNSTIRPASGNVLRLDVSGADLTKATFAEGSKVELTISKDTVLDRAVFADVTLSGTDFRPAQLKDLTFHNSTLRSVQFRGKLANVNFGRSRLHDVSFADAFLTNCNLSSVVATRCEFDSTEFVELSEPGRRSLENSTFIWCSFADSNFASCNLMGSQFIECDLRRVKGLVLDDTVVRDTVLSPGTSDNWSVLRRSYTGANMIFNLIFLIIFFLPFIFSTVYWTGVNQLQLATTRGLSALDEELARAPAGELSAAVQAGLKRLINPQLAQCLHSRLNDNIRSNPACLPIWKVLLGVHEGPLPVASSVVLLTYNLCRLMLTWFVAPLRDEEKDFFHSPARRRYGWLVYLHKVVRTLFYLAIVLAVVHLAPRLMLPVWLANG